jgi:hypothetical protein
MGYGQCAQGTKVRIPDGDKLDAFYPSSFDHASFEQGRHAIARDDVVILNHQVVLLARARLTPFGKRGVGRLSASAGVGLSQDRGAHQSALRIGDVTTHLFVARQPPVARRPCEAGSVCGCIHHRVAFFGGVLNAVVAASAAEAAPAGSTFVSFFQHAYHIKLQPTIPTSLQPQLASTENG